MERTFLTTDEANNCNISSNCNPNVKNVHNTRELMKNNYYIFDELSFTIKEKEVLDSILSLKNNKSGDILGHKGEMFKAGATFLVKPLTKLFNLVFTNTLIPDFWRESSLSPIHKKGDYCTPGNYRGIAISNISCKLFCKILNTRLNAYLEKNSLFPGSQIGFRKNYRTVDHILTLKTLIDKYVNKKSKHTKDFLYVCFVDLSSAFDTIWRAGLFHKMSNLGIGGIYIKMLKNIYEKVYFRIKINGMLSNSFESNVGVKQGYVMSPTLFNIYLSDICNIFNDDCAPVSLKNSKLNCLLYADDMVLISQNAFGLQECLNKISCYFDKWKLKPNINKTKILIFNKSGKKIKRYKFIYNGRTIEIAESYQYLGLVFRNNGNFNKAINILREKGRKAVYILMRKLSNYNVTLGTYAFEVWASSYFTCLKNSNLYSICEKPDIEKVHLQYMKFLLGVHSKSTNDGVRGELGEYPILINMTKQYVKFWLRISKMPLNSLIYQSYLENKTNLLSNNSISSWIKGLEKLLKYCSLGNVSDNENYNISNTAKITLCNMIDEKLKTLYCKDWHKILIKVMPNSVITPYIKQLLIGKIIYYISKIKGLDHL